MASQKKSGKTSRFIKTALAFVVTLLPIVMILFSVAFSNYDPRSTLNLTPIKASAQQASLFNEALVTISFDDGSESIYNQAAKILEKHDIPTTQYILSGTFDNHSYLSRDQVKSLFAAGHDIQSHTVSHPNLVTLGTKDLEYELKQSRYDISQVINQSVTDFASPLNSYNDEVLAKISSHYRSHRNTVANITGTQDIDFNTSSNFDPYSLNGYSIRNNTTPSQITDYINMAKQRNAWIILIYHEVKPDSDSYYNIKPAEFDSQMKAIKDSGIKVTTIKAALDEYFLAKAAK